jgi:hypothetical protein
MFAFSQLAAVAALAMFDLVKAVPKHKDPSTEVELMPLRFQRYNGPGCGIKIGEPVELTPGM